MDFLSSRKYANLLSTIDPVLKSDNLQYNTLVRWFAGSLVRWFAGSLVRWNKLLVDQAYDDPSIMGLKNPGSRVVTK